MWNLKKSNKPNKTEINPYRKQVDDCQREARRGLGQIYFRKISGKIYMELLKGAIVKEKNRKAK